MEQQQVIDALIIGGSVAGLSAALTLARARRSVLVIDAGQPCNRFSAQAHMLPGFDGRTPSEITEAIRKDLAMYPTVRIRQGVVERLVKLDGALGDFEFAYSVSSTSGTTSVSGVARAVVLAAGIVDEMPKSVKGASDLWGDLVIHCPFCHGYEAGGRPIALLYGGPPTLMYVRVLPLWANKVSMYLQREFFTSDQEFENTENMLRSSGVDVIRESICEVRRSATDPHTLDVFTAEGQQRSYGALMIKPKFHLNVQVVLAQLEVKMNEMGLVHVEQPLNNTSVKGLFAAGDCINPYRNLVLSEAEGAKAGVGLSFYLAMEKGVKLQ